jgi:elongation factor G
MTDSSGALNIGLVGPYTSGKTTLLESLLFVSGAITRRGKITDGNTVGDWSDEARARQSSVEVNAASFSHGGRAFTVLDCPGSIEFFAETSNALMGVDLAIVVCSPDTSRVWTMGRLFNFLSQHQIPHVVFANRMDEAAIRIADLIEAMQPVSAKPLVPCQVAVRDGENITGYVDLMSGQAYEYRDQQGANKVSTPDTVLERQDSARTQLLENLADFDDTLLENLLEDKIPSAEEIHTYLKTALMDSNVTPVFMGSAERDWGVRRLLEALIAIAPPSSRRAERLGIDPNGAPVGQVIKTYITQHGGKVSLARIWGGTIEDGAILNDGERIGGMYRMFGQQQNKIDAAQAGEIVGLGRLESIVTGDTVAPAEGPGVDPLPRAEALPAVYGYAVRAAKREDEVKVSGAMSRLAQEDPSLRFQPNPDTQEAVLYGQGEMHLKVALDRLANKYGLSLTTEKPKVAYKEAIRKPVSQHARYKKQTGGHGQFGDVHIEVKPLPRGVGFEFQNTVVGGAVPKQYIPAVEAGVRDYLVTGPLGFPVVDVSVTLTDGKYHAVDSSEQAFKTAGRMAMAEALPKCNPVLLEPVYEVRISVPNEFTPNVQRLVTGRRGQVLGFSAREDWPGWDQITSQMPQTEMHDLIIELRSLTLGVGSFESQFDHLQELTGRLADDVLAAAKNA